MLNSGQSSPRRQTAVPLKSKLVETAYQKGPFMTLIAHRMSGAASVHARMCIPRSARSQPHAYYAGQTHI